MNIECFKDERIKAFNFLIICPKVQFEVRKGKGLMWY